MINVARSSHILVPMLGDKRSVTDRDHPATREALSGVAVRVSIHLYAAAAQHGLRRGSNHGGEYA